MTDNTAESTWFKSSYSGSEAGSDCVEVAIAPTAVHVRDSKRSTGPSFAVGGPAWARFVGDLTRDR
ncbi:DUF397 domain-containing protein [Streptomyces sp. NPDC046939]|uniref:DUF397 domain-containing protein n=1 Tax=Streptomyces sp. NPDC046939 TaxID=3155376 RepID=UPI0033F98986